MEDDDTMNETLLELVRHKTWANLLLLESCERLTPEELNASAPGTYGTIHETLRHLVDSDESYFATITGHRAIPVMSDDATIGDMAQRVRQMSPSWESLVVEADLGTRDILTSDGWRTKGSIPMAQSIHHANDHRAHILTILGAHDIELAGRNIGEDFDVWHHGIADGDMELTDGADQD